MSRTATAVAAFVEAGCSPDVAAHYAREIAADAARYGADAAREVWHDAAEEGEDAWLAAVDAAIDAARFGR